MTLESGEARWPSVAGVTDVEERRRILGEHVLGHPEVVQELVTSSLAGDHEVAFAEHLYDVAVADGKNFDISREAFLELSRAEQNELLISFYGPAEL